MAKKIIGVILVLLLIGVVSGVYIWNKPHKKVEDAKGIEISAVALSKEYNADEKAADAKYLNKAINVSGTISEVDTSQDAHLMLILQTGDPMTGIQCAMRDKGINVTKGGAISIKGFCSGNGITGVALTDCVLTK